jgi:hypothetical protein
MSLSKSLLLVLIATTVGALLPTVPPKDGRIAIIGAGPAGVHMASKLKQLGYANITILERTQRVGGKSFTLYRNGAGLCKQERDDSSGIVDTENCIAHEMGTCFLHNGYHTVRDLVDEYGLTREVAPEGRAMFSNHTKDMWSSQEMDGFVTDSIMELVNSGKIKRSWWVPKWDTTITVMTSLVDAMSKYNALHKHLLGEIEFSMPERLSKKTLQEINVTFAEFLENNGLQALAAFLSFAHAAQGYGYVKSIPALYGLWWISPELLSGYLQMSLHEQITICESLTSDNPLANKFVKDLATLLVGGGAEAVYRTTTMLPEGYGKLWQTIYEKDKLNVLFGIEIPQGGIDRKLSVSGMPGVSITFQQNGGPGRTEEFDFLIYTAPHASAHKYVRDLTRKESSIFGMLQSFVLSTTLYKSDAVKDYTDEGRDAPIMYNTDKMDSKSTDGSWYADRNDPRIFGFDKRQTNQTRVGYQFFEDYCSADSVLCDTDRSPNPDFALAPNVLELFKRDLQKQRVTNPTILGQYSWPYFHHFPQAALAAGLPWDLLEMQGSSKTWWLGASASFESVHDVTNYNLMLLKKQLGVTFASRSKARAIAAKHNKIAHFTHSASPAETGIPGSSAAAVLLV